MSREYPCVYYDKARCVLFTNQRITSYCVEAPCPHQKPSNADRIRAMTDEELAEFLEGDYGNMMPGTALKWLREEAEKALEGMK